MGIIRGSLAAFECLGWSFYATGRFPLFAVRLDGAQLLCLCFCLDAAGRCSYSPFMLGRCFWYFASPSGHLSAPVVAQRSRRHYVPASDVAALLISLFAQAAKACSLMANEFAQSSAPFCSLGGLLPRGARFRVLLASAVCPVRFACSVRFVF